MAAHPRELDPSASVLAFYGAEVRRLRDGAGLTLARLAEIVNSSKSHLGHIETAERTPTRKMSEAFDAAFATDGHFIRLYPLVRRAAFPDFSRRYMELEAQAAKICVYMPSTVHGLLQTEGYARAILRTGRPRDEEQLEERVSARIGRQSVLNGPEPALYWVILDEAVIRRPVGGDAVMRGQLEHLLTMAEQPRTVIQVLPFARGEHAAMGGSLEILHLGGKGPDAAYGEGSKIGYLVEDPEDVAEHQFTYDLLRASALPPDESAAFIQEVLEVSFPCESPPT